jgi:3-oxoacyl-[acyl-carrier protein] reductase
MEARQRMMRGEFGISKLSGKTALVTNASHGIGRACALGLAAAGAQVLIHHGRDADAAETVVGQIHKAGRRAGALGVDLADPLGPHKLAKQARGIIGDRLDILVANAGLTNAATLEETTIADFNSMVAVNVRAPFFLVQQLLPILCKGSSIIFVSSLAALSAVGSLSAYAATKGAIDTVVKHFATALGPRGIRVNAIVLRRIETGAPNFAQPSARGESALGLQTLERPSQPDDIGSAVAFLASADARWVSGDTLRVTTPPSYDKEARK